MHTQWQALVCDLISSPEDLLARGGFHPHSRCSREKMKLASCPRPASPRPGLAPAWS